jgi:hypothetical protein
MRSMGRFGRDLFQACAPLPAVRAGIQSQVNGTVFSEFEAETTPKMFAVRLAL